MSIKYDNRRYGTPLFPLEFSCIDYRNPRYVMPAHWHMEFELIQVLEGTLQVFINNICHEVRQGDLIMISNSVLHSIVPEDCVYECLVFDLKLLLRLNLDAFQRTMQSIIDGQYSVVPYVNSNYFENSRGQKLKESKDFLFQVSRTSSEENEYMIVSALYAFFASLQLNSCIQKNEAQQNENVRMMKRLISYIEKNYQNNISLLELSQVACLSPKYLCRFFKTYTNKTPIEYLNVYRIECACNALVEDRLSITDLAYSCGFNDLSYFIKMFKKVKGVSPTKYTTMRLENTADKGAKRNMMAADRFLSKRWGVFNHYLNGMQNGGDPRRNPSGRHTDWNTCVNEFDVEKLAYRLHKMCAGYYFITLMQANKFMIAPNATFDAIAGTKPGEACTIRDLPEDLYKALSKYDIDLFLYYTGDGPYLSEEIGEKFGMPNPRIAVTDEFVTNWASVLEEYAVRYGDKVKGWWIDGCYNWLGYNNSNLAIYDQAIKKGNPNGIIACNNGINPLFCKMYEKEEFVTGEFNDFEHIPPSRFIDGAQSHILAPLGELPKDAGGGAWCFPGVKRSKEYMVDYIGRANAAGAPVTIDVCVYRDGSFSPEQEEVLYYIGQNL